jgi:hypothetical protein
MICWLNGRGYGGHVSASAINAFVKTTLGGPPRLAVSLSVSCLGERLHCIFHAPLLPGASASWDAISEAGAADASTSSLSGVDNDLGGSGALSPCSSRCLLPNRCAVAAVRFTPWSLLIMHQRAVRRVGDPVSVDCDSDGRGRLPVSTFKGGGSQPTNQPTSWTGPRVPCNTRTYVRLHGFTRKSRNARKRIISEVCGDYSCGSHANLSPSQ